MSLRRQQVELASGSIISVEATDHGSVIGLDKAGDGLNRVRLRAADYAAVVINHPD